MVVDDDASDAPRVAVYESIVDYNRSANGISLDGRGFKPPKMLVARFFGPRQEVGERLFSEILPKNSLDGIGATNRWWISTFKGRELAVDLCCWAALQKDGN